MFSAGADERTDTTLSLQARGDRQPGSSSWSENISISTHNPNTMRAQLTSLNQSDPEEHRMPANPYVPILLTVPVCPRPADLALTSIEVLGHKGLHAFCV